LALSATPAARYVDRPALGRVVAERGGRAALGDRFKRPDEAEIDFLGLGCSKS
jgi:hypothetical protein